MHKQFYATAFLMLCAFALHATHNLSGEIIFKKTGGLGVEATIVTYTKASSVNADRDSLTICWGDGTCQVIARNNGDGVIVGVDIKKNTYTGFHTYSGQGVYKISMTDANRSHDILNINPPNSENVAFHVEATVKFQPEAAMSMSSPVFLAPPVDVAYAFQPFSHVPNAFDLDGDSLAYSLVKPMAETNMEVPNYLFPNEISPSDDNKISLNPYTGEFLWNSPIQPGHYVVAILVKSFRNGVLVETTLRDLFIDVLPNANYLPQIALVPNIQPLEIVTVAVGQTVNLSMTASDPDAGQTVALSVSGGPFEGNFQEKATFVTNGNVGKLTWKVTPEYLRDQPYQFVFKAKDDFMGNGLAANRVVRFKVISTTNVLPEFPGVEPLSIMPNPTTSQTTIQLPAPLRENATLQIFNGQGELMHTESLSAGVHQKLIELSTLLPGLYFIDIQTVGGKRFGGKISKN